MWHGRQHKPRHASPDQMASNSYHAKGQCKAGCGECTRKGGRGEACETGGGRAGARGEADSSGGRDEEDSDRERGERLSANAQHLYIYKDR